jgi:prepilin signal peptidase PulO-like enzyme (type II secretory pathway)
MALPAAFAWARPDRDALDIAVGLGAALAAGAFFFVLGVFAGRGATGFGMGDVKLVILAGLLLGWPLVVYGVFLGIMIAGVPAVALIVLGRGRSQFAYGPYLAAGIAVVMLFPKTFEL